MRKIELDRLRAPDLRRPEPPQYVTAVVDAPSPRPEQQLILVYLGSATCGACHSTKVQECVAQALSRVREAAVAIGLGFRSVGIAVDSASEQGFEYLSSVGPFDELSSGGSWFNLAATRFLWGDLTGDVSPAIPQLIVMYRRIDHIKEPSGWSSRLGAETILLRLVGGKSFGRWAASSFPIPWNDDDNRAAMND